MGSARAPASHDDVAKENFLKGTVFEDAGRAYDLNPLLLYAVALGPNRDILRAKASSPAGRGRCEFRVGGIYADTRARACARLHDMMRLYHDAIDVGLIQVLFEWHGFRVARPTDLLDPATNVTAAAAILAEALESCPVTANWGSDAVTAGFASLARGVTVLIYWALCAISKPLQTGDLTPGDDMLARHAPALGEGRLRVRPDGVDLRAGRGAKESALGNAAIFAKAIS